MEAQSALVAQQVYSVAWYWVVILCFVFAVIGAIVATPIVRNNFKDVDKFMGGIETNDIPKLLEAIKGKVADTEKWLAQTKAGLKL